MKPKRRVRDVNVRDLSLSLCRMYVKIDLVRDATTSAMRCAQVALLEEISLSGSHKFMHDKRCVCDTRAHEHRVMKMKSG